MRWREIRWKKNPSSYRKTKRCKGRGSKYLSRYHSSNPVRHTIPASPRRRRYRPRCSRGLLSHQCPALAFWILIFLFFFSLFFLIWEEKRPYEIPQKREKKDIHHESSKRSIIQRERDKAGKNVLFFRGTFSAISRPFYFPFSFCPPPLISRTVDIWKPDEQGKGKQVSRTAPFFLTSFYSNFLLLFWGGFLGYIGQARSFLWR